MLSPYLTIFEEQKITSPERAHSQRRVAFAPYRYKRWGKKGGYTATSARKAILRAAFKSLSPRHISHYLPATFLADIRMIPS